MKLLSVFKRDEDPAAKIERFWAWFKSPEGQRALSKIAESGESQSALKRSLSKVHTDMVWGIAISADGTNRTLEISAGGLKSLIPTVRSLVDAAPAIEGWQVVAFKQPSPNFSVAISGIDGEITSATVLVSPRLAADGKFDLEVFVPVPAGCPREKIGELGFIFLDHTLGEYAVMTRIGELSFELTLCAPPTVIPLAAFAAQLPTPD